MKLSRRETLSAGASAALVSTSALAEGPVTPERFGAVGDGRTNDTAAFAAMAAFVNRRGGGIIRLRPTTYIVGSQASVFQEQGYAFAPSPIMEFVDCREALIIEGDGARLRCAPGLRYGTFDPLTGSPTHHSMPYVQAGELASPYKAMIRADRCSGPVEISDLELDGNLAALRLGGPYGDTGRQIPAVGIHLLNNRGPERISRVHVHGHALDGILIDGSGEARRASSFRAVRSENNGRQACSITGGSGYEFIECSFSNSGKAGISSAPGAGVDIEPEAGKKVADLRFLDCKFSNNSGPGLVADSANADGASFENCVFIGTTNWAAWPNAPNFRFSACLFVGPIVHAFGDPDAERACRFSKCTFRDDPALTPNGLVYGGENPSRPIADLPNNRNVLFDGCTFRLTHRAVLPWTTNVTIFSNCVMSQRAPAQSYPRGTFVGRNVIIGNAVLYSARIKGELVLNGRKTT